VEIQVEVFCVVTQCSVVVGYMLLSQKRSYHNTTLRHNTEDFDLKITKRQHKKDQLRK